MLQKEVNSYLIPRKLWNGSKKLNTNRSWNLHRNKWRQTKHWFWTELGDSGIYRDVLVLNQLFRERWESVVCNFFWTSPPYRRLQSFKLKPAYFALYNYKYGSYIAAQCRIGIKSIQTRRKLECLYLSSFTVLIQVASR
jgi:hypothetical protein